MEWTNELLEAAHLGKVDEIKRLLCTGSDPNSRGFIQAPVRGACSVSRSALHVAAIQSHYECIIELIRRGAHINVQDEDGYTPSHYLCQKYVTDDEEGERISKCLKVLFKFGASARIRTFNGQLSLHDLALRSKNWFCAKIVEEEASKVNSLKKLCRFAVVNYLQIHCKKGVQLIDQLPLPSSMKSQSSDTKDDDDDDDNDILMQVDPSPPTTTEALAYLSQLALYFHHNDQECLTLVDKMTQVVEERSIVDKKYLKQSTLTYFFKNNTE